MFSSIVAAIAVAFFSGLVASAAALPLAIRFALRSGIVDVPGERRIHKAITPRSGGLAVYFGTHVSAAVLFYSLYPQFAFQAERLSPQWWLVFFLGSTCVTLVGLIDDYQNLRPLTKLAGQTAAALIMVLGEVRIESMFGYELPVLASVGITVIWFLFATNIFNLIDGLDGLATGLAAIASLGIAGSLVHRGLYFEALFITGFIGSALAFFRANRFPARVFLGDAGSNFLGFFLAAVTLQTGSKSSAVGYLTVALFALGIPILDTLLAVWRRSNRLALSFLLSTKRPGGIMAGDLEHLHHRLLDRGLSQRDVVAFLHLANAVLVLVGLVTLPYQQQAFGVLVLTGGIGIAVVARYVPVVEFHDTVLAIIYALAYPSARVAAFLLRMAADALVLAGALSAVILLFRDALFLGWFYSILVWCSFPFVSLTFAEIVCARERMPRMIRLRFISSSYFAGIFLSFVYVLFWHQERPLEIAVQTGLFALISYAGIMGLRIFWETVLEAAETREEHAKEAALRKNARGGKRIRALR